MIRKHHWQDRHRFVAGRRMGWYGASGDEQYGYLYWKARLNADYYLAAASLI